MIKRILPVIALGVLCAGTALAQSAPPQDGARHQWMEAHKGDMAQWHARMCTDMYAHHVGMVAELGARLDLSESQRPLFERWKTAVLDNAKSREGACATHTADMGHRASLPEREAHMRQMLKDRLAAMDAQQPALDALYNSLNPSQKTELDHMGHGGMHGGMHHGMGGMHRGPHGGPDGAPPPDQQG
jgi:LTXXQ motif family protein